MSAKTRRRGALVMPGLYFVACMANLFGAFGESEGSWGWFPFFVAGLPGSLLALVLFGGTPPALVIFGTLGWYFLSRMVLGNDTPEASTPVSSRKDAAQQADAADEVRNG